MKIKTIYICQNCGVSSSRWQGKCHECGMWNTFEKEEALEERKQDTKGKASFDANIVPQSLADISSKSHGRIVSPMQEFNRVLGGGFLPGMFILLGGDPGVGKSTLLLQVCNYLQEENIRVVYVAGEESPAQIKLRATRLGFPNSKMLIFPEVNMDRAFLLLQKEKPELLVVDSIQSVWTPELQGVPGSVSQMRELATRLMRYAKTFQIPVLIIGHVTKEGVIAGPRILEHMVDTVLYFEGEQNNSYRILRAVKNRFGPTNEIGVFEMTQRGLAEVDPNEIFLAQRQTRAAGAIVVPSQEGTRPILVEVQALVTPSASAMVRRAALGIDPNRISMLLAVIEKHMGIKISGHDVYMNVAGGLKLGDPSIDLGLVASILSSFCDAPCQEEMVFIGELSLTGAIRSSNNIEFRVKEALQRGFNKIVLPKHVKLQQEFKNANLIFISNIEELRQFFFKK